MTITVSALDTQNLALAKSKGTNLGDLIYLYQISPYQRSAGSENYEAQAEMIITKALPASPAKIQIQGQSVELTWNSFEFEAVEAPKSFIFENFEIPTPLQIFKYVIGLLLMGSLIFGGWKLSEKLKAKRALKAKRSQEKKNIISATSYADVVLVWKNKAHSLKIFPQIESDFKKLEDVLFKYQFKQSQSQYEVDQVMDAYKAFAQRVSEVLRGI